MEENWKLSYSGQMSYLNAIGELIDYRRIKLPCRKVLDNVAVTEIYLKRAKKCIGKMMKVQWTKEMDIDTLEAKGNWASMEEMLDVIPYHLPRYKGILERCKNETIDVASSVTAHDLSFANKFIANYLFINVKSSRPMTYQYLTLAMIENAKVNGGFVDQRQFKTAARYGFDSLILDRTNIRVLDDFIKYIRPRLKPKCDYLLLTRHGTQYMKLCDMIHPSHQISTDYRDGKRQIACAARERSDIRGSKAHVYRCARLLQKETIARSGEQSESRSPEAGNDQTESRRR